MCQAIIPLTLVVERLLPPVSSRNPPLLELRANTVWSLELEDAAQLLRMMVLVILAYSALHLAAAP